MQYKEYPTRTEADAEASVSNRRGLQCYCPMLRATCHADCICLTKAYVTEPHGSKIFQVWVRICKNHALHGGQR